MIETCCICGGKTDTIFKLPFIYPDNIGEYTQHIGICEHCGFIFTQNPLTSQQLEDRYKSNSKYEFDSENYNIGLDSVNRSNAIRQKKFVDITIAEDYSSVLEIGAASGYNLSLYKDKKVLGIEPSERNCVLAKKNYNVDLYNGMFSEYIDDKNYSKYDLIFISHTLEHIVNPYDLIRQCQTICNKYIFIEVPTIDCKLIDEPFGMFCDEHVNLFSLESLMNMMYSLDFQLLSSNIIYAPHFTVTSGNPCISTIWKKSDENNSDRIFAQSSKNLILNYINGNIRKLSQVQDLIKRIDNSEKLAVWGVGNHLSMLLANTDLSKKNIVKFYDSDVHKYSSTLLNIPICAFDEFDIYEKRVDAILIGTYTAQKAISKILEKYKNCCKIYYLYDL